MATFTEVCTTAEIPAGTMKGLKVGDLDVVVANVAGDLYAVESVCPHMSGHLARGKLEGADVVCPVHGARYDVKTGKVTKDIPWLMKKMSRVQPRAFATYPVQVRDGKVFVGT